MSENKEATQASSSSKPTMATSTSSPEVMLSTNNRNMNETLMVMGKVHIATDSKPKAESQPTTQDTSKKND